MPRWIVGLVLLWICSISAASGVGWHHQENTNRELERQAEQIQADRLAAREAACLKDDERNAIQRRMSRDAPLEVGEAIIEVAGREGGNPPAPAVIAQLREVEARRLEGIVNQLPAWRWDPETATCVEVPLDTGG